MPEITIRTDMTVQLVRHSATDLDVAHAAWVSTMGDLAGGEKPSDERLEGVIRYLMENRHGSPFEHNSMTFMISAPIFVFREFHRHRIGWSYNEESGRYTTLKPVFYVPSMERPLKQVGKPGHYEFVPGGFEMTTDTVAELGKSYVKAYQTYLDLLDKGVAREVARASLPVATYSSMYATCNARSLMNFLSLRTKHPDSTFPSYPQREIEMVAEQMEEFWSLLMPVTHAAFTKFGRVAP